MSVDVSPFIDQSQQKINADLAISAGLQIFQYREPLTGAEWADRYFYLSPESSSVEGRWETLPYQRGPLNWMCDDDIEEVNWQKSKRVGYTKLLLAAMGCLIEHKRRNVVLWQPTDGDRDRFSKTEVDAMLRDVPAVGKILRCEPGAKDKNNTIEQKAFFGAMLDLKGGKSGGSFRAMTKDVAMYDELDAFDRDVDKEGSPLELGDGRLEDSSFPKSIRGTTPKIKGSSLIEAEIRNCDVVMFRFLPCPHCGRLHRFEFANLKFDSQCFACPWCGSLYPYGEYRAMDEAGRWQTEDGTTYYHDDTDQFYNQDDEVIPKPLRIGIKIWAAYSYFRPWSYIVKKWTEASAESKVGNDSKLKATINTILGETYEEKGEKVESGQFTGERLEDYDALQIPNDIVLITIGADVQGGKNSRIELEVCGWGLGFESWSLDYVVIPGDPEQSAIWDHLDDQFLRKFTRDDGVVLPVAGGCVDSGYLPDRVFAFTGPRRKRNIYATKGKAQYSGPLFKTSTEQFKNKKIVQLAVNTDNAKETVFHRLNKILEHGPGYCHFPKTYEQDYFRKLTNEEKREKKKGGMVVGHQWVKLGPNEPLDCRTGNLVAVAKLNPPLERIREMYAAEVERARLNLPRHPMQGLSGRVGGRRVRNTGL